MPLTYAAPGSASHTFSPPTQPHRLQYKRDAVAADGGADRQAAALREQRRLLEERAATLQRQVEGLVQVRRGRREHRGMERGGYSSDCRHVAPSAKHHPGSALCAAYIPWQRREEQDEELQALRARLAGEWDAGAAVGGRSAQEQGAALAAQLAEARQRCAEFAQEADGLRAEAARLAGAHDGAEAALAAAQAELAEVKSLLLAQEQGGRPGSSAAGSQGATGEAAAAAAARLAAVEAENRRLASQLAALQAGAERHQAAAAVVHGGLDEVQQVRRLQGG